MWRDILIMLASVLAVVSYFSLPARRRAEFAQTIGIEETKRARYKNILLVIGVLASMAFMSVVVYTLAELSLAVVLIAIVVVGLMWYIILTEVWKLTQKRRSIANSLAWFVVLPLFIAGIVLSDISVWQKVAYPVGAGLVGHGISVLIRYIDRKLETRLLSRADGK
jgi:undecaprenyl pyrophosphate phosphatase UppP